MSESSDLSFRCTEATESMSISDRHVPHVLQNYSAVTGPVCLILPVTQGGFSGARIWKVESKQGIFALRRWPAHGPDSDRLRQLHDLLSGIEREGKCPVAGPRPDDTGETLVTSEGARWQLEPWLPGRPLEHSEYGATEIETACAALADWHSAAAAHVTRSAEDRFRSTSGLLHDRTWFQLTAGQAPCVAERLEFAEEWIPNRFEAAVAWWKTSLWKTTLMTRAQAGDPQTRLPESSVNEIAECLTDHGRLARETHSKVLSELRSEVRESRKLQPCLRDVWSDHMLFSKGRVSGIIDPSAARTDSVATDLARLLGSVAADSRHFWKAGLASYERIRALSESDYRLVRILDRSAVLLSPITWLLRVQKGRVSPEQAQDVVVRLQSLVARHRTMVANTD